MNIRFRPLDGWPGPTTRRRRSALFSAAYTATLNLLDRELTMLGAEYVAVQLNISEADIRLDGLPRSSARPATPGIVIAFDSRHGPLKYACDAFTNWKDNLRAIALGLESLRRVDRYGISKRGEQYTGWKALPGGPAMTTNTAVGIIARHARIDNTAVLHDRRRAIATARKATHPDTGGSRDDFERVQQAAAVLEVEEVL